jgi:hypothetical protein
MIEHRKPNLALSYKIIEKHHGKLSLANKIGLGSEVMISIPIVSVVLGIATPSSNASTHLN